MNRIIIMSVPGSGTRFVQKLLHTSDQGRWHCGWKASRRGVAMERLAQTWLDAEAVVVCPVRDPMLVLISNTNHRRPVVVEDFHEYASRKELPEFFFFRLDCPPEERADEMAKLRQHVGIDLPMPDWMPDSEWVSADTSGLKALYLTGNWSPVLHTWATALCGDEELLTFYRDHLNLEYPWMATC